MTAPLSRKQSLAVPSRLFAALLLGLILLGGAFFRFYHISWDAGYLFHPDERQLLVVVDKLSLDWPPNWPALLTPASSWNPGFFAYGSLPMYLLRICADWMGRVNRDFATLQSSYMVGRTLSALFDLGTVYLVYWLGRKLYHEAVGLIGAALTSLTVLHIQMSHFFTVDTILTFFIVLAVLLALNVVQQPTRKRGALLGLAWGMALATKVSAAALGVTVGLAWLLGVLIAESSGQAPDRLALLGRALAGFAVTCGVAAVSFVIFEPYALIDVVTFVRDIFHEGYMVRGIVDAPYTRQFIGRLPYFYPMWQSIVWSLGAPLGIMGWGAALASLGSLVPAWRHKRWKRAAELLIPLSWVLVYWGLTGSFHAKFLRYMLPLFPFLNLWAAWALWSLLTNGSRRRALWRAMGALMAAAVFAGTGLYALAYLNVYRQEHPWIQATAWICANVPRNSQILVEHWDDPLPMLQGVGTLRCYGNYQVSQFEAYNPDDTGKLADLLQDLQNSDYIILSSNRLYNTIPRLPGRYPLTSRYYQLLMGEKLGFRLVYDVEVYPRVLGVSLMDDTFSDPQLPKPALLARQDAARPHLNLGRADESMTVYDHPKPLIFQKTRQLSQQELLALLGEVADRLPEPPADE